MTTVLTRQLREGIAAAQARQFDQARALLEPVTESSPDSAAAWFWLAVASPSAGAAIPCLRRVLEIDSSRALAREALANLLVTQAAALTARGQHDEALGFATEATALMPDVDRAWVAVAAASVDRAVRLDALRRAFAVKPLPATRSYLRQTLLHQAMAAAKTDRAGARALFQEAAALDPTDGRVWHALAQLADTPAAALEAVRELMRCTPEHAAGRTLLKRALVADARALEAADQGDAACSRWREVVAVDAQDVDAWLGLAASTRDPNEIRSAIEAAFEVNPADARVAAAMAELHGLDLARIEPPPDAFARLTQGSDVIVPTDPTPDAFAELDLAPDPLTLFAAPPIPSVPARHVESATLLPFVAASTPVPEAVTAPLPLPAITPDSNGSSRRTVMLVDDSPTIRKILGTALEHAGYTVVTEPDGESAIERLHQVVPDVILLHIAISWLDGYDVCKRIKKDPRTAHVPVVMLSDKDAFLYKVKGHVAGATEYLTKPFELPAVLAAVSNACHPQAQIIHG